MARRVLHLVGSPTDDLFADLSCLYARGCLDAVADAERWEHVIAHVSPDGSWRFPARLDAVDSAPPVPLAEAVTRITELDPDVAVPQLFCRAGMTTYRALLDVLGLPYPGNTPDVMALGANKARARAVVAAAGVDVPEAQLLRAGDVVTRDLPVVVKPVDADNSAGVSLVRNAADLPAALAEAFEHSAEVLAERFVPLGREVRCGVLERDGELVVLPLEEYAVHPDIKPVRDAGDKLARDTDGGLHLVAKDAAHAWIVDPDDPITTAVGDAARAAHRALGCRDYSLFDFRIDPEGRPWFLEAGLYCSFSPGSVVAVMAAAAGVPVTELFAIAVDAASARRARL